MSLISICLRRLTPQSGSQASSLARRHAAAARLSRPTGPEFAQTLPGGEAAPLIDSVAEPATEGETSTACGWYESSQALRQGLAVTEWEDSELSEGLLAWQATGWAGAQPAGRRVAQACS